jgi:ComF family protein
MRVYNWIKFIQTRLFSEACPCCGSATENGHAFCYPCSASLPYNDHACSRCALPLPPEAPPDSLCGRCSRRPPHYQRAFAALSYQPPVSQLIGSLKFRRQLHLVRPLAELMIERLGPLDARPDLLIPVPLHPLRLRERGFNQSLELARALAAHYALSLDWRCCRRIRATPAQSGLNERERRRNLRAAFRAEGDLRGLHLVLFDDVITTGATIGELSKTLMRAGAKRVDVWALARTATTP